MSEIGLDDSHVRSHFHVQASEAVAGTVKGDFLGYPCCREPPLEWSLQHLVLEILKDKSLAPFSQQSIGFITDGVMHYFFGFLHTGGNEHPAVGVWLYLLPRELSDGNSSCRMDCSGIESSNGVRSFQAKGSWARQTD